MIGDFMNGPFGGPMASMDDEMAYQRHLKNKANAETSKSKEEGSQDKSPSDFDDKFKNLKFQKDSRIMSYYETIDQIRAMAQGEDPEGLKAQFYEGWKNEDFVKLLEQLGEDVE